jgi:EAL domain-containing protein (putative c-di-GMP-specific phosphodiesterase class I)
MHNKCAGCGSDSQIPDLAMAFQPIVDAESGVAFAYEALVRGPNGEGAQEVLQQVTPDNLYAFDQRCRVEAIRGAVAAGILETGAHLSINFLPNAVYSPMACIQLTLKTAQETGFPTARLIFEFTENEHMADTNHVRGIVGTYKKMGFSTAIDDFGAESAGLRLLTEFETDFLKLDMELIRGIGSSARRQSVVKGLVHLANSLGTTIIAEGVETAEEYCALRAIGVRYFQGYYLARPGFRHLPAATMPADVPDPSMSSTTYAIPSA